MNRRTFNQYLFSCTLAAAGVIPLDSAVANSASDDSPLPELHPSHRRTLAGSSESLPSIGMGTWITFDVPDEVSVINQRTNVLREFFRMGGRMIDSSPMYGRAEQVVGECLAQIDKRQHVFAASKIWTPLGWRTQHQLNRSRRLWQVDRMDLMYVHNLLNWEAHLPRLRELKESGKVRYIGLTTSHGRRHTELESLLKTEVFDVVQLTYNYANRSAADRLIPLAADKGITVVANRPFQRGRLVDRYRNEPLPGLARELGCSTWAQYLLLFVVSHPQITMAIPATSRVDHMLENMAVMQLPVPDSQIWQQM